MLHYCAEELVGLLNLLDLVLEELHSLLPIVTRLQDLLHGLFVQQVVDQFGFTVVDGLVQQHREHYLGDVITGVLLDDIEVAAEHFADELDLAAFPLGQSQDLLVRLVAELAVPGGLPTVVFKSRGFGRVNGEIGVSGIDVSLLDLKKMLEEIQRGRQVPLNQFAGDVYLCVRRVRHPAQLIEGN